MEGFRPKSLTRLAIVLVGTAALAACVPPRREAPPPPQPQPQRPVPPRLPPPPPPPVDWRDLPLTPGGWTYRQQGNFSQAVFGPPGGSGVFTVECDRTRNSITMVRDGVSTGNMMTVRTSYGARNFPRDAGRPGVVVTVPASDRFLDGMAFSRGRFTVEAAPLPMLVIPAWPEPARVIEDCRG